MPQVAPVVVAAPPKVEEDPLVKKLKSQRLSVEDIEKIKELISRLKSAGQDLPKVRLEVLRELKKLHSSSPPEGTYWPEQ